MSKMRYSSWKNRREDARARGAIIQPKAQFRSAPWCYPTNAPTGGAKVVSKYTESAIRCHDASIALWYAVIFAGAAPPFPEGGPEEWQKQDPDRGLILAALQEYPCTKYERAHKSAVDECLRVNAGLVYQCAKRFKGRALGAGLETADLIQEGNLGLVRAVQKYDPSKGFSFSTYAYYWVFQAIQRAIAGYNCIHIPINRRDADTELGELAKRARKPISLSLEVGDPGQSGPCTLGELLESTNTPATDSLTAVREDMDHLACAMLRLTPRESRVLRLRFFDNMTLEQVGEIFGLTRERIRQVEVQALSKLRDRLDIDDANLMDLGE